MWYTLLLCSIDLHGSGGPGYWVSFSWQHEQLVWQRAGVGLQCFNTLLTVSKGQMLSSVRVHRGCREWVSDLCTIIPFLFLWFWSCIWAGFTRSLLCPTVCNACLIVCRHIVFGAGSGRVHGLCALVVCTASVLQTQYSACCLFAFSVFGTPETRFLEQCKIAADQLYPSACQKPAPSARKLFDIHSIIFAFNANRLPV